MAEHVTAPATHMWPRYERCDCPIETGGEWVTCAKPLDHRGECFPDRAEIDSIANYHERRARDIRDAMKAADKVGGWA